MQTLDHTPQARSVERGVTLRSGPSSIARTRPNDLPSLQASPRTVSQSVPSQPASLGFSARFIEYCQPLAYVRDKELPDQWVPPPRSFARDFQVVVEIALNGAMRRLNGV